ncbi:MAG: pilus assembly protein PilP, partial [Candidatus Competibacteraceae bacterium]|nr:pilus assembly protein PilP [Candidatus Competibacteraceae bacterium]
MNLSELNDLDFSTAGNWPLPFKVLAVVLVVAAVGAMGYYLFLSNLYQELESSRQQETQLRQDYRL